MTPVSQDDRSSILSLLQQLEEMRWIKQGPLSDLQAVREYKLMLTEWKQQGHYGNFAIRLQQDGSFAGLFKVYQSARSPYLNIGYILRQKYWGQGVATEVAKAGINYLCNTLEVPAIDAFARVENKASAHILEVKLGMNLIKTLTWEGRSYLHYRFLNILA